MQRSSHGSLFALSDTFVPLLSFVNELKLCLEFSPFDARAGGRCKCGAQMRVVLMVGCIVFEQAEDIFVGPWDPAVYEYKQTITFCLLLSEHGNDDKAI